MSMIWRVGLAAVVVAVLGGFFVGRVMADSSPLPSVGDPVRVGPSERPTPSEDPPTLRPRDEGSPGLRGDGGRAPGPRWERTPGDDGGFDDNGGDDEADDNSGSGGDDGGHGRGRGRGRGGDEDDVRTVEPSPEEVGDDDGGDDNGGDDNGGDDGGGDDGGGDDSGGDD
jgi:hypothetical protein